MLKVHYKAPTLNQPLVHPGESRQGLVIDDEQKQISDSGPEWFESYASDLARAATDEVVLRSPKFENILFGFADDCWEAAHSRIDGNRNDRFLTDSAAGADVVSFLETLESQLPAPRTTFQIAVICLIEGLSAFSDLWCAFFRVGLLQKPHL
jgi:hypothetical protein